MSECESKAKSPGGDHKQNKEKEEHFRTSNDERVGKISKEAFIGTSNTGVTQYLIAMREESTANGPYLLKPSQILKNPQIKGLSLIACERNTFNV